VSATYLGPVYVAHYCRHGADGTLTDAMHRRVAAPTLKTAATLAKAGLPAGWKLAGVREATTLDKQMWL
jgi:hypothetical protein